MELPTLSEFVKKATKLHKINEDAFQLEGPHGIEYHRVLIHKNGSYAFLPRCDENEPLNGVVFAHLCRRLGIPAQDFGISPDFLVNPVRHLWDTD